MVFIQSIIVLALVLFVSAQASTITVDELEYFSTENGGKNLKKDFDTIYHDLTMNFGITLNGYPAKIVPADPDVGKNMVEIVQTRGYTIETHYVTTSDGYILTVFNIPRGKNAASDSPRNSKPVLLQHGLLDSSYTWVNNFEDESLGYLLADQGFDVWFGNNRGNRYGRNHTTLNPDDGTSAFWTFSWDEMAAYDLPAMINFVAQSTNTSSIGYVGHSEGTIQMFAAGTITGKSALVRDALAKVNLFVALAPVAYVSHLESPELVALANTRLVDLFLKKGIYEFLPYGKLDTFAAEACRIAPKACDVFLATICGPTTHINETRIQVYVSETPAGTSTYNMAHWMQGVLIDNFQMLDYGSDIENRRHYGQTTPPLYNLGNFKVRTALFTGTNDYLADPTDVKRLVAEVPAESVVYSDNQDDFAHLDFTWAYDANTRIYNKIATLLNQYAGK